VAIRSLQMRRSFLIIDHLRRCVTRPDDIEHHPCNASVRPESKRTGSPRRWIHNSSALVGSAIADNDQNRFLGSFVRDTDNSTKWKGSVRTSHIRGPHVFAVAGRATSPDGRQALLEKIYNWSYWISFHVPFCG
jgi:hypothetical protein